jgi:tetratricopeptide (TPR) repeat protein
VALGLALGYAVLGQTGFALVELDRVDPARLGEPEYAALVPLTRALVFSRLGFLELATREATGSSGDSVQGQQALAAIHAILAYGHATKKDWERMDRELAQAVRIWPNNPLVVFLSGERLLADGRKEQALETFARAAAGSEAAWLAPLVEKRIRQVRDSTGDAPPLLLDHEFIAKCVLHSLIEQAQRSEPGRKFAHFLATAQLWPANAILQPEVERTSDTGR